MPAKKSITPKVDAQTKDLPECFVIMPISELEGYPQGHFRRVYEDILSPACLNAGFKAFRADDSKSTNLIQLEILERLIESPMALCDLSSTNPNVMFELALRQAFDKPVALIQEVGTRGIFDINGLRFTEYRKERTYHEVLLDQEKISEAIKTTYSEHEAGKGVNSIVKLLGLSKAKISVPTSDDREAGILQILLSDVAQIKKSLRTAISPDTSITQASSQKIFSNYLESQKCEINDLCEIVEKNSPILTFEEVEQLISRVARLKAEWIALKTESKYRISVGEFQRYLRAIERSESILKDLRLSLY